MKLIGELKEKVDTAKSKEEIKEILEKTRYFCLSSYLNDIGPDPLLFLPACFPFFSLRSVSLFALFVRCPGKRASGAA